MGRTPAYSPWFELPPTRTAGIFVSGTPGPADALSLEWGRVDDGTVAVLATDDITEVVGELAGNAPWRFFSAGDLPVPPAAATVARIKYLAGAAPSVALAVTSPVTYSNERLAGGAYTASSPPQAEAAPVRERISGRAARRAPALHHEDERHDGHLLDYLLARYTPAALVGVG
jgi:hypothetical protein